MLSTGCITDAVRLIAAEGDGFTAPDSSVGLWPATTNDLPNGNFQDGTTGWTASNATLTASADQAKFGSQSGKFVSSGSGISTCFINTSVAAAGDRSAGIWVYATPGAVGKAFKLQCFEIGGAVATGTFAQHNEAPYGTGGRPLVSGWQRITASGPVLQSDRTSLRLFLVLSEVGGAACPGGITIYLGGGQMERSIAPTPYAASVRTDGRVQLPAISISPANGWFGLRIRTSWHGTTPPSSSVIFWHWADDATHQLVCAYEDGNVVFRRIAPGGTEEAIFPLLIVANTAYTILARWTATRCSLSINGQPFANAVIREFYDDFERPDQIGLGVSTSGHPWYFQGQHEGRIVSGRYQGEDLATEPEAYIAVYERIEMASPPVRRTAKVSYMGTTGQHVGNAMISTDDPEQSFPGLAFRNMLHPSVGASLYFFSVYEWAGDHAEVTYLFSGLWPLVEGATHFDATFGYNQLYTDGRVYDVIMDVDVIASALRIRVSIGDIAIVDQTVVDPRVATMHGRFLIWQVQQGVEYIGIEDVYPRYEEMSGWVQADNDPSGGAFVPGITTRMIDVGSAGDETSHLYGDVLWCAAGRGTIPSGLNPGDDPRRENVPRSTRYLWDAETTAVRRFRPDSQIEGVL